MEYSKLVSVTGLPGLFELLSSKADGGVVKSLEDKSTKFVSTRVHNFSHIESIEVFTTADNVNLADVFKAMAASNEKLPAEKDAAAIKKYFETVYPAMDFSRVYASDMKKMVKWFTILQANNIEIKLSDLPETDTSTDNKPKAVEQKAAAVKNAPAKKINAPRKMA
ncbi:MAG: DUF5606 domain-containing protein [Ferruginibacter sp.]|nr:DUF5606 domain-containing protein [Ferruginibacter sp.]